MTLVAEHLTDAIRHVHDIEELVRGFTVRTHAALSGVVVFDEATEDFLCTHCQQRFKPGGTSPEQAPAEARCAALDLAIWCVNAEVVMKKAGGD